jgi:PqqD family protein of HPr-rel-A system
LVDPLPAVWRPLAPDGVAWREWGDELVVYNDATGSTHHLSALGAEVLLALLRSPAGIDMATLARDVAARVDLGAGVQLFGEIERALKALSELRLAAADSSVGGTGCP